MWRDTIGNKNGVSRWISTTGLDAYFWFVRVQVFVTVCWYLLLKVTCIWYLHLYLLKLCLHQPMCRGDMTTRKEDGTEQIDINNILRWTQVAFTAVPGQLPWPDGCIKKDKSHYWVIESKLCRGTTVGYFGSKQFNSNHQSQHWWASWIN